MAEWGQLITAKIIVSSRYMRNTPKRSATDLVKYMGTREGVEKVAEGIDNSPATVRQQRLVQDIIKFDSSAKDYGEYQDYESFPIKSNASEFIDAFIERNADRIGDMDKLVSYMAERPGVEKLGSHGLFSQTNDKIDLDSVAEKVGQHKGIIWTHVISLHREDAERLGYNRAEAWRELVRRNVTELAEAQKIDISNLQWYGAFHNTAHHPHMHLLVYSKDAKQGWLTKKGIDELRSALGNDIFRLEQYKLFTMETGLRDRLKKESREKIERLLAKIRDSYAPTSETEMLFLKLVSQLKTCKGRKQYGYLPKDVKDTVNKIVAELAKNESIAKLNSEWNKVNREKLSLYFEKKEPDIPLEDNPEFRSIKNVIVRSAALAMRIMEAEPTHSYDAGSAMRSVAGALCKIISKSYDKKIARLNTQIDSKLRSKIEQKKVAHGLKTDRSVRQDIDDEDYSMRM
ncbi:MobP3 family relaxase [Acutalibacter muris]|uniref:MobP3 family relaxase n=1 Tax=Acutalibacter muris TaxID=1796620 RepID=UPI0026F3ED28|nr:MobP3 family relaxase [Acutalibacter muris]